MHVPAGPHRRDTGHESDAVAACRRVRAPEFAGADQQRLRVVVRGTLGVSLGERSCYLREIVDAVVTDIGRRHPGSQASRVIFGRRRPIGGEDCSDAPRISEQRGTGQPEGPAVQLRIKITRGVPARLVITDVPLNAVNGRKRGTGPLISSIPQANSRDLLAPESPRPLLAQPDGPGRQFPASHIQQRPSSEEDDRSPKVSPPAPQATGDSLDQAAALNPEAAASSET